MSFGTFGQAAPKQGFGGFGQSTTGTAATTSPFTSQAGQQQSAGLFGSQAKPSGGLFGSTAQPQQQQQQQQQQQTGGLFGSGAAANGTSTAGVGGSLFGQPPKQQQQQGGLFGSTSTAPSGSGGLFGQPQGQSGGMFGSTAGANTAGGGLFGSSNQQPAGSGLFSSTSQSQQQSGLNTFGQSQAKSTGGLFGSNQPQQQSQQLGGNLLGSIAQSQPQQGYLFNPNSSTSQLGQSQSLGMQLASRKDMDIESRIKYVQDAWDSSNPSCRFKCFFYNVVEDGTAGKYGRPPGANDDVKWAKALRDNPDSNSMVPVLAVGWDDLKNRQQLQENVAAVHQERIKEITAAITHTRQTSLSSSIRLANLQARQTQLIHRLIYLAAQTPKYIPIAQSTVFKQEEADMLKKLESVKAELEGTVKSSIKRKDAREQRGRLLGQINELWGRLEEIRRRRKARGQDGREQWLGDEKVLAEIAEVLATQQNALQKLSDLAHEANFDVDVMLQNCGSSKDRW
ncbi:uncharacterized protein L203_104624 [Cryptococcus depauperatus CBS 7841]|uniref:Uncharacterized protein n=1 Tax=Cryptococcus depauperatus CBS 7841 TaxID=1295531 RepID=A0A1E3ILJ6_9TREE|nr:hypothetical protein L203_02172 [Cryptococcus depauperatus CBS 7841]